MLMIMIDGSAVNYTVDGDPAALCLDTMKVIRTIEYEFRKQDAGSADLYRKLITEFMPENIWSEECTITEADHDEESRFGRGSEAGVCEPDERAEDQEKMD